MSAVTVSMQLAAAEEVRRTEKGMSWLATTAGVAPFIGLFGTVWGIIDAFSGLGTSGSASLRAVAPGIAEALVTTAAGLFAAIPALIAYNYFLQDIPFSVRRTSSAAASCMLTVTADMDLSLTGVGLPVPVTCDWSSR